jgi:hypothetical protein
MRRLLDVTDRLMELHLDFAPRVMLVAAALLLVPTYLFPLWSMTFFAPQYPDGLRLYVYSYKLDGGRGGQDIREVNVLNHYIGMKDLDTSAFDEFKWIPFVVGALALLFLRAMVLGRMRQLVDVLVLFAYFSLFALWSFTYQLWSAGHDLSEDAAVKVPGFMPPVVGYKRIANFEVYSYPGPSAYALGAVALVLVGALIVAWRQGRFDAHGA